MRTRWVFAVTAALTFVVPAGASAHPGNHGGGGGKPTDGARTLRDPILPQIGNGGYDAAHYRIALDYDPATNTFNSARTTMWARATATLDEFSLDFQDLPVSSVTVNGKPADFEQVDATPQLSTNPAVTQPMKLVVDPHPSARPKA